MMSTIFTDRTSKEDLLDVFEPAVWVLLAQSPADDRRTGADEEKEKQSLGF